MLDHCSQWVNFVQNVALATPPYPLAIEISSLTTLQLFLLFGGKFS